MFAACTGQTTRPPVTWYNDCTQFQISKPYVLCVSNDSIKVYNLIDSKLKQEINIAHAKLLKYIADENIIIISTNTQICALNILSLPAQVEQLLLNNQVDEAVSLFECLGSTLDKKEYENVIKIFLCLNFYYLKILNFNLILSKCHHGSPDHKVKI